MADVGMRSRTKSGAERYQVNCSNVVKNFNERGAPSY